MALKRWLWAFAITTVVLYAAAVALGLYVWLGPARATGELAGQNRERTVEIQRSRLASCHQTYEGIRQVLKPFFPPPPRTKTQQAQLDKFNRTVNRYKRRCGAQTSTKEAP